MGRRALMKVACLPILRIWPGSRQSTIRRSSGLREEALASSGCGRTPADSTTASEAAKTKSRVRTGHAMRVVVICLLLGPRDEPRAMQLTQREAAILTARV